LVGGQKLEIRGRESVSKRNNHVARYMLRADKRIYPAAAVGEPRRVSQAGNSALPIYLNVPAAPKIPVIAFRTAKDDTIACRSAI